MLKTFINSNVENKCFARQYFCGNRDKCKKVNLGYSPNSQSDYKTLIHNSHGMICKTRFFFMLAGKFPVLILSFWILMEVSF